MINPGKHPAVVVPVKTKEYGELACQFGKSSKKGTPQVAVAFEILRGPDAGKVLTWIGYFTEKTEDRTLDALRTCGFTGNDIDQFCDQRPTNEVEIVVELEEDQKGNERERIAWVNAPSRGFAMADQLRDKELKKFGSQFKAKLKTMPEMKTTEAKREAPSAGARDDGDETPHGKDHIPF